MRDIIEAIYEKRALPVDIEYYQRILDDPDFVNVSSQIYSLLKQQGRMEQTPPFFQKALKEKYNKVLYLNIFIQNQMMKIVTQFEKQGINVIPLKGVLFSERYFHDIGARPTSDIDLLIRLSDVEKAIHTVKLAGFIIVEERIPGHFHCSFSKELPNSDFPLTIELHWDILRENTANFNIAEFWEKAKPLDCFHYVMELSDYHTFYLICLHGWRHNLDSLKYFIDIIQILNTEIDYSILFNDAKRHQTLKRVKRTLSIVYKEFPLLSTIKEFPGKRAMYYRFSKNKIAKYLDFIDYQFLSYDTMKHCFKEIKNWVLPGKSNNKKSILTNAYRAILSILKI